jgi:protein FAM32A
MSFVGGKLNLKGGLPGVGKDKRKKKKKTEKGKDKAAAAEEGTLALVAEREDGAPGGGSADAAAPPPPRADTRTDAQKRHDAALAAREAARIRLLAAQSHRERVADFNDKLAAMSEHHDIPKVGPG